MTSLIQSVSCKGIGMVTLGLSRLKCNLKKKLVFLIGGGGEGG